MKNLKRILAVLAVILILGLYLVTFICAVLVKRFSGQLFMACIAATVLVPFLLYLFFWIYGVFYGARETEQAGLDERTRRGFVQAAAYNRGRAVPDGKKVSARTMRTTDDALEADDEFDVIEDSSEEDDLETPEDDLEGDDFEFAEDDI